MSQPTTLSSNEDGISLYTYNHIVDLFYGYQRADQNVNAQFSSKGNKDLLELCWMSTGIIEYHSLTVSWRWWRAKTAKKDSVPVRVLDRLEVAIQKPKSNKNGEVCGYADTENKERKNQETAGQEAFSSPVEHHARIPQKRLLCFFIAYIIEFSMFSTPLRCGKF